MSSFSTLKASSIKTSDVMTRPSSPINPRTTPLASQSSMGNQAINRFLSLGPSGQPGSSGDEGLIVITDEIASAECVDFFLRDPEVSDERTGTLVHKALQNWMDEKGRFGERFRLALPTGSKAPLMDNSYTVGGPRQGPGYFDLAYKSNQLRVVEGAELKPANAKGYADALVELQWYLDKGNADEELKREHGITEFRPMEPWKFPLPHTLYVESRRFRLIWCAPGIILYKEIGRKKDRDAEEKKVTEANPAKGKSQQRA